MGNYKNKEEFNLRILNFTNFINLGHSVARAAKLSNISYTTAYKYAKNLKVKSKNVRNLTNHNYFDIIDTEIKAYLLGFLLADGCISKGYGVNTIVIHNSIDEYDIIKTFKEEICPENKILFRKNKSKKDTCSIKLSSSHMVDTLINKYKIKPNKTFDFDFIFPFNEIDDKYIKHFIRGFFDGDGSIGSKHIEFLGTSYKFMCQLEEIFFKNIGCTCNRRIRKTKNTTQYYIYLNGLHWKIILNKVYTCFYEDSIIFFKS